MAIKRPPHQSATTRKLIRERSVAARDQFAALGQFIQAFEGMVHRLRHGCIDMTKGFERGVALDFTKGLQVTAHIRIYDLIFSHNAMTARPMLDLWRAILAETIKALPGISVQAQTVIIEVQDQIAREASDLIEHRNNLIHATWQIGIYHPFKMIDEITVEKGAVTKRGFASVQGLPQSVNEILSLTKRCRQTANFIAHTQYFIGRYAEHIPLAFKKEAGKWVPAWPVPSPPHEEAPSPRISKTTPRGPATTKSPPAA